MSITWCCSVCFLKGLTQDGPPEGFERSETLEGGRFHANSSHAGDESFEFAKDATGCEQLKDSCGASCVALNSEIQGAWWVSW